MSNFVKPPRSKQNANWKSTEGTRVAIGFIRCALSPDSLTCHHVARDLSITLAVADSSEPYLVARVV
jgi:hypothetical protein